MSNPMDLEITIISAKHLKNVNWQNGDLSPYSVLTLSPNPRVLTKPDPSNGTKPVWNERFLIPFPSSRPPPRYLTLEVFHSKLTDPRPSVDILVGSVEVSVPDPSTRSQIYDYELERPSGRPHGKIKLKLAVLPRPPPPPPPQVQDYRFPPQGSNNYNSDPMQVHGYQFSPATASAPPPVPRPPPPPPQQFYQGTTPMPRQHVFNSVPAPAYPPSVPRPPPPQQSNHGFPGRSSLMFNPPPPPPHQQSYPPLPPPHQSYPPPPPPHQQSYPPPPSGPSPISGSLPPQQYNPKDPYYEAYCQGYKKCYEMSFKPGLPQQSYAGEPSAPIDYNAPYNQKNNGASAGLAGAMKGLALKEKVGKRVDIEISESETENSEYSDSCSGVQPSAPVDYNLPYDGNRMRGSENVGSKAGNGYGEYRGYN